MYLAIVKGHPEVVRLFIEGRADHMMKDCSGRTRSSLGRRKITLDSTSIATDAWEQAGSCENFPWSSAAYGQPRPLEPIREEE